MNQEKAIKNIVIQSVELLAEDFDIDGLSNVNSETLLYGNEGLLDSMALVNLIADIEENISEEFNVSISLADEKAMSSRHSPYQSVTSLTKAIIERIEN